jgi:hypothetical protein
LKCKNEKYDLESENNGWKKKKLIGKGKKR